MAGKPGMKGGGGKREGAGRKKAEPVKLSVQVPKVDDSANLIEVDKLTLAHKDPKIFLLALMNDLEADIKLRADAAKSLMPFMHMKKGEGGIKDARQDAAKKAAVGKFGAAAPPKLIVNNR